MAMASVPRPTTTYSPNEQGQFRAAGSAHHRSATLPTPHTFPPPAPSAMHSEASSTHEVQRQPIRAQHMLPHAASMPRLKAPSQTPLSMSTPVALQLPTPFELPPVGQILSPETPLPNPYDDLYGHLGLDSDAPPSGSSTPTPARSRSPATTAPVRSRPPGPSVMPMSTTTPAPTTTAFATTSISTTTALGLSGAISTSGPSTSTSASASSAPEPPAEATQSLAAAAPPGRGNSSSLRPKWGPNEYPPEKREVRLEPPVSAIANFDDSSSSSSLTKPEDFADSDCPPAYSS
ncbi:hypothetical protein GSI_04136 [Ganoderma sinense ZZ0214-1]|uniref:Uncharacterized protein n=1 Tax=Ganoderma sinense ZZ0214-1 TaxID=1077348 RepID=A0A2G8SIC3_9APHY|nr:hypothetical protein GSI_04136 [Ganoderma sinense ZZ0214-1]